MIRAINKYSNNVMARQLFLTIGAEVSRQPANAERAQRAVGDWLIGKGLERREFVLENGAGLSRVERLSAAGLSRLSTGAFAGPLMPEFVSSLPLVGVDGTMRKRSGAAGTPTSRPVCWQTRGRSRDTCWRRVDGATLSLHSSTIRTRTRRRVRWTSC